MRISLGTGPHAIVGKLRTSSLANALRVKGEASRSPGPLARLGDPADGPAHDISAGRAPGIGIAPELQHLLATLGSVGTVVVMSLFRRGQGPHGVIQPDGSVICPEARMPS
jgi:hypothetical protein